LTLAFALTITTPDQEACGRAARLHAVGRRQASAALMAGIALALTGYSAPAHAQAVRLVAVDIKVVDAGYRASKLIGRSVENDKNQKIGTLDDLVVDKDKALHGILQVGSFLGLGGYLVAVPYDSLDISDDGRKITLAGASKEALGKLPQYQQKN
jgi:sporulation protein YlmC with PRC-barrel domain